MHTVNPSNQATAATYAASAIHGDGEATQSRRKKKKKGTNQTRSPSAHQQPSSPNGCYHRTADYEDEGDDYVYEDSMDIRGRVEDRGSIIGSDHHASLSPDSMRGAIAMPFSTAQGESKSRKKKKKKRASEVHHSHKDIWYKSDAEEKQRIREFWLQLREDERRALVKLERDAVLKKMKEQQKQTCSCSACGRKRVVIEEELEALYDAYYVELENFANDRQPLKRRSGHASPSATSSDGPSLVAPGVTQALATSQDFSDHAEDDDDDLGFDDDDDDDDEEDEDEDDEDEDEDDEDDEDDDHGHDPSESMFEFGSSLTVKGREHLFGNFLLQERFLIDNLQIGGILTVADDFLKNDGQKFLDLMEQLADRRIRQLDDEIDRNGDATPQDFDDNYDDDEFEDDDEEDAMTEEQRMEEGRRMFQIFAAKMFEQRVLQAYREKVAQERQMHLLAELEREKELQAQRELNKQKQKEKKRQAKKLQKQQKEEERLAQERKRLEEEERLRLQKEAKAEADRKKRESERAKREEERAKREEEERRKREAERARKEEEKRRQREAEERKRKEREERERQERERKENEKRERELRERRELEERQKREKEEQRRRELEERERREREALERREREEAQLRLQQQRSLKASPTRPNAIAAPQPPAIVSSSPASRFPLVNGQRSVPSRDLPLPGVTHGLTSQLSIAQPSPTAQPPLLLPSSLAVGPRTSIPVSTFIHHQQHTFNGSTPLAEPGLLPQTTYGVSGPGLHLFANIAGSPLQHGPLLPAQLQPNPASSGHLGSIPAIGIVGAKSASLPDAPGPIPNSSFFNAAGYSALHWPTQEHPRPVPSTMAESIILNRTSRTDASPIGAIGSHKAVSRPTPIQRPNVATAASSEPPSLHAMRDSDDDGIVAGSASLGGESLNDDERISGGSAWRKASLPGMGAIPHGPRHGVEGAFVPSSAPSGLLGSTVGAIPGASILDGFGPFSTGWDAPPTLGGSIGEPPRTGPGPLGRAVSPLSSPSDALNMPYFAGNPIKMHGAGILGRATQGGHESAESWTSGHR
ncbi:Stress response protein nst1 [Gaertneriomyces sp. JEL0708]|nr:Stress response protein nst1 [Gaertneriomyces sp. JEL0708]